MEVDMDLISQRSAHESGHTSSGASTATMSHRQAISDGLDIADDRNEHMLPSAVPGGSNDTSSSSIGARPYYHPEPPADGTTMFLTQRNATSSSIMSYTAGSGGADVGIDDGNLGAAAAMSVAIGSGGNNPGNPSLGSMLGTVRNLIGASVTTGAKLNYIDGSSGIFFVFPDLSIRKDGIYRFRFSFFDLKRQVHRRVKIPVRKESGKNNDADDDDWIN
ncbi:hypothetical protein EV174_004201 [Coemansia sp. RSA 2320]|nr:hypothetical protein EV174_004201 [Coemansia sp. RSA 2320]